MKKIILLVFVTLFCCVGYSQAQTTKKMTRQEKKEAQKAMEQALFEEARQAIENKAFTLEADRVIFKRGRNAKSVTMAKHATMIDYRMATGFEALMGYLYLTEQFDRLVELAGYGLEKIGEFETE